MKRLILIIFFALGAYLLKAQSETQFKGSISTQNSARIGIGEKLVIPQLSYIKVKEKTEHEFGLNYFRFGRSNSSNYSQFRLANELTYIYKVRIYISPNEKFKANFMLPFYPYFYRYSSHDKTINRKRINTSFGAATFLGVQYKYFLNDKFFLDFDLLYMWSNIYREKYSVMDSGTEFHLTSFNFDSGAVEFTYRLNFGLGIRI